MHQQSVVVVGGAGYIGSHMVRWLQEQKQKVVVLDNLCNGHRQSIPPGVPFYQLNMEDQPAVVELLRKYAITHVMHFAAHAYVGESVNAPLKYYDNNVSATVQLLKAMQTAGVKHFVFSSSCATYGTPDILPISEGHSQSPINPYGQTKLVIEHLLRSMAAQKQISYAALRYFNAAGASADGTIGEDHRPESHLIPLILQVALEQRSHVDILGDDYPTDDGTCLRDYIHVEDLASAHGQALKLLIEPGQRMELNLGTGTPASVKQVIDICRQVTGHPIPVQYKPRREGDPAVLYADNTQAKKLLNWQPRYVSLKDIIATAWQWHKSHPHGYSTSQPAAAVSS